MRNREICYIKKQCSFCGHWQGNYCPVVKENRPHEHKPCGELYMADDLKQDEDYEYRFNDDD